MKRERGNDDDGSEMRMTRMTPMSGDEQREYRAHVYDTAAAAQIASGGDPAGCLLQGAEWMLQRKVVPLGFTRWSRLATWCPPTATSSKASPR